jgi:hypothetical protein
MALSFPNNPTTGQTTTQNGRTYSWSGYAWEFVTQNVNSARSSLTTTSGTSTLSITGGYVPGYLDLFQNGVKLLSGSDYTATDGTSVTLSNSAPSGTTIEYITLLPSINNNLYTKLDSISSSFNGSSTSFGLSVSGTAYYPVSANTLGIYVGGVAQEPISSYSVSGSNIVFTEAPASGLTFWGVGYGTTAVATLNGIVPGSVSSPAISSSNDLSTGFYFPSSGSINIASSGYDRFKIDYKGDILIGGQNINSLRYLDINNINNLSNAGSILRLITSNVSGVSNISADIVKYKNGQFAINNSETDSAAFTSFNVGNSERLRITSSGNVGIGTTAPNSKLHVVGDITANSGNFSNSLQVNNVNVSVSGHSHTASDITNFNSSVSGLLPITNIVAGNRINVAISGTTATITSNDTRWDLFLPPAPTGVAINAGNAQVTVSWTAPTVLPQTPITDYTVQYSSNSGTTWTTFSRSASTETSATVTGLTNGTSYLFRVAGINQLGVGSYSSTVSAAPNPQISVSYLLVGGGGGGGSERGGGGGAGGYLYAASDIFLANTTISVTVGPGGNGGSASSGNAGSDTVVSASSRTITAYGGGYGARGLAVFFGLPSTNGGNGGSGGGGSGYTNPGSGGTAVQGQGNSGGSGYSGGEPYNGGGGGGAGGAGVSGPAYVAVGGVGKNTEAAFLSAASAGVSVNGSTYIAGGGAAGTYNTTPGAGGFGGGGAGGNTNVVGVNGSDNTGGGGGGGGNSANGGSGGSGVAIIRVSDAVTASSTTGSPAVYTTGGYRYYKFTSSGTIRF